MISQEKLLELFDYNEGNLIWKVKKRTRTNIGDIAGHTHPSGYIFVVIDKVSYGAHRLIFLYHYGYIPETIDHINGIRCDNRIENLRPATHNQQMHNKKMTPLNTSGIKGVSFYNSNKRWYGKVSVGGKDMRKCFFEKSDAESWVINMRKIHHKEFANNGFGE